MNKHPNFSPSKQVEKSASDFDNLTDDEKIDAVARRILERNREAFLKLASGNSRCG